MQVQLHFLSTFFLRNGSCRNYGEENRVGGDSGYLGADKRDDAVKKNKAGKKIKYNINRRPSSLKKLSRSGQYYARKREHEKSSVRCKV